VTPATRILHASTVAVDGRGLLILGPSGAGKSALALQLIALGAALVADDQTEVTLRGGTLLAQSPASIHGLIEARGIGILRAPALPEAPVTLAVDLEQREDQRLPPSRSVTILGCRVDLVLQVQNDHFPAALMLYLRHGRQA
jgi:HPr kinase/phosphorylase